MTYKEIRQVEINGKAALAYIEKTTSLVFSERDNSNFIMSHPERGKLGYLFTDINKETGHVTVKWKPDTSQDNYSKPSKFTYDALDGIDDSLPFVSWITEIKEDLGL